MSAEIPGHVTVIDDPSDPRVRDYFSLTDVALRKLLEVDGGSTWRRVRRSSGAHSPRVTGHDPS